MASNFLNQIPGFPKLPFGWRKPDQPINSSPSAISGSYRPRKSISEAHRPRPRMENQMSMSLINKGLLNPTGENNCFLNATVQILWHIDVFRRSFRKVKGHMCVEKACIFCALKSLFNDFQHGGQSVIPPDILRQAMAECYEEDHRFQLGLMDDAAECFEKILEQVHLHMTGSEDMDTCSAKHCLSHQKFSLTILERTECVCGATSEPLSFVQFVHYISSSAIAKEAQKYAKDEDKKSHAHSSPAEAKGQSSEHTPNPPAQNTDISSTNKDPTAPITSASEPATRPHPKETRERLYSASQVHFGKILNQASSFGEYRRCPDYERCKKTVAVKRILLNCPDVVCLGMIWDSAQPSVDEIMSVVLSIGLTLQLNDLFDHVFADGAQFNQYELTALIAYYGRHYSTFCYHSKMREWIYFDDAKFRTVGTEWEDVCEEIRKAHYQPLLLVYTNPFGEELDLSEAPQVVTKIQPTQHDHQEVGGAVGAAGGGGVDVPVSSVPKETPEDAGGSRQKKSASEAEPIWKGVESTHQGAGFGSTNQKSADSRTHAIDPMTLSLIPTGITAKSVSPVLGDNPASATPTSRGTTPTSARELSGGKTGTGSGGNTGLTSTEPDLMSFSISPAILKGITSSQSRPNPVAVLTNGRHQLESLPTKMDATSENLIEFSLTPAQLGMARNSAVYNSGSKHRQLFQQPPLSTGPMFPPVHSGSRPPIQPGSQSNSTAHSHSPEHTGSHSSSSVVANQVKLHPNWEHFSDESLKPTGGPPQKLISKVGGTGFGSRSNGEEVETNMNKSPVDGNIQKAWTVVSMLSGPLEGQGDSAAVRQLQRVASQPGFNEVGGANVIVGGEGEEPSIGEFMLQSVAINDDNSINTDNTSNNMLLSSAGDTSQKKSGKRFSPLPPTPNEGKVGVADQLLLEDFSSVPEVGGDLAPHRQKAGPGMLLDDLEFAFPTADNMFPGSAGAKVKVVDDKNFDYAELDLDLPMPVKSGNVGVTKGKGHDDSRLDYAVIRSDEPRYEFSEEFKSEQSKAGPEGDDDYTKLVDVTVGFRRDVNNPIGGDPLYSVPDKTKRATRQPANAPKTTSDTTTTTTTPGARKNLSTPIGQDPDYAVPNKVWLKADAVSSKGVGSHGLAAGGGVGGQRDVGRAGGKGQRSTVAGNPREQMSDMLAGLDKSTRQKLTKAQNLFAQAEASSGSDDTVAMMLYQQFSSLLFQVLQDPVVSATPTLHHQIKTRRDEGVRRCQTLQRNSSVSVPQTRDLTQGSCKGCGKKRDLDDQQLCGPCQLRAKLKQR